MASIKLHDIQVGQVIDTDAFLMTTERIKSFAKDFDPQPMHLDEEAAMKSPFGKLTARGWHTLAIAMRLMAQARPFGDAPLIGVGVTDIQFLKPVYANDSIYVHAEVSGKRASSKPGRGFVTMNLTVKNNRTDEAVLTEVWTVMVPADDRSE